MIKFDNKEDLQDIILVQQVRIGIENIFKAYMPQEKMQTSGLTKNNIEEIQNNVYLFILEDLMALTHNDPAARDSGDYVLKTYKAFQATMYYRISNAIYYYDCINDDLKIELARKISEDAKKETLVEIHPAAKIGPRFIIDHGIGTVIGETSEIGSDCYILNGVILGAPKIKKNPSAKRHPTLGDQVEIGPFARIIGPIHIGDDVVIGAHCYITKNIPSHSKVQVINEIQILRSSDDGDIFDRREIYGVVPEDNGIICIYGKNLKNSSISMKDKNFDPIDNIKPNLIESDANKMKCKLSIEDKCDKSMIDDLKELKICISEEDREIIIMYSLGLIRSIENLINN